MSAPSPAPLSVAFMGCGAMGSVLAGMLAGAGHRVLAITRDAAHARAMAQDGLVMDGPDGRRRVALLAATAPEGPPVDLLVIATKAGGARAAARAAAGLVGPRTIVFAIQNGIGAAEEIAAELGAARLAVGVAAGFGAGLEGPGQVRFASLGTVHMGVHAGLDPAELAPLIAAWEAAGVPARLAADVQAMQWEKLICNAAYSGPCAASGLSVGEVLDTPELAAISAEAATEAWETARALGIALAVTDPVAHARAFGEKVRPARPSVLQDIDRGRISEIAYINGAVVREAARLGRRAPVNATLTALVQARERRAVAAHAAPTPEHERT